MMPAPVAALTTPLYSEATSVKPRCHEPPAPVLLLPMPLLLAMPDGGLLLREEGALRGALCPACMRTLMVSNGWMVLWLAARAMAPATTSWMGFSGAVVDVDAMPVTSCCCCGWLQDVGCINRRGEKPCRQRGWGVGEQEWRKEPALQGLQ
jgi:hypothetical protein